MLRLVPMIHVTPSLSLQNLCVHENRGGKAANQQHSRTVGGGRAAAYTTSGATKTSVCGCGTGELLERPAISAKGAAQFRRNREDRENCSRPGGGGGCSGSIGSIERRPRHREGGQSMREAFPSLPYGSPVLDREISKINSNNISSKTSPAAPSGTPQRCHSTSPNPPYRGQVEREGETSATPPSFGTTITSGGSCSASAATSPVPSHHHLNIIKEGGQTLERDNFLSNISAADPANTDGKRNG